MGEQRSLLPGRAQRETRVAADVSLCWGNDLLGLRILYQGPWKDRTGWGEHRVDRQLELEPRESAVPKKQFVGRRSTRVRGIWEAAAVLKGRGQFPV